VTTNAWLNVRSDSQQADVLALPLPATFGDWRDYGFVLVPPEDMPIQLILSNMGMGDDATLWIQSVDITELTSE
jgi:hypothetical protein